MSTVERAIIGQILPLVTGTVFALGLCIGSFLNVCIWRMPRGESIITPGSHCPKCGHHIRAWENIPVLSWLLLGAKCSSCKQPISWRYPLIELVTGIAFTAIWAAAWIRHLPLSIVPPFLFLTGALIAVTLTDLEHLLIPDKITRTGTALAFAFAAIFPRSHLTGSISYGESSENYIILDGIARTLRRTFPGIVEWDRTLAVADCLAGALLGYGILWMLLQVGKLLWGRLKKHPEQPVKASFSAHEVKIENEISCTWKELFFRPSDSFTATTVAASLKSNDKADSNPDWNSLEASRIRATNSGMTIDGTPVNWDATGQITAKLSEWTLPREAMGFGDLKLLAMTGAFLGPDACLFILMFAAVAGCACGTLLLICKPHRRHAPIPFGPFIAAAGFLWMLAGPNLVNCYSNTLMRVF